MSDMKVSDENAFYSAGKGMKFRIAHTLSHFDIVDFLITSVRLFNCLALGA